MTCHSNDPWEHQEELLKRAMRVEKIARYIALFSLMMLFFTLLLLCIARFSSPKKISQWQHVINNVIREEKAK